ncbi:MAG TPA: DUF4864 domain-containing protein [Bryobacteraceae bacterium]|nr:DUF4864 domain-containing protein [Bryobacteraceae bacterium]
MTTLATTAWLALLSWVQPNPGMAPGEVVAAVVDALRHNNSPHPNAGVLTVYHFASPANRRVTGPYGHFFRLVKSPAYQLLFHAAAVEFGEIHMQGDRASQDVATRASGGESATFRFDLSRQPDGPCAGCWMVDGVTRLP